MSELVTWSVCGMWGRHMDPSLKQTEAKFSGWKLQLIFYQTVDEVAQLSTLCLCNSAAMAVLCLSLVILPQGQNKTGAQMPTSAAGMF